MLALKLLLRNWRSGEVKLLGISLVLAVAVLSGIAIFTDRLESTLVGQSNNLLGADNIISGTQPQNPEWLVAADKANIKSTQISEFSSMVYAGDEMHLAGIKAVTQGYPLRGQLDISEIPFAMNASDIHVASTIPERGEVWVDSRLLPLLKINLGDKLTVGEYELTVTHILIREPDSVSPFSSIAPRVLMNAADIPLTQVIQPGSRVEYELLLASDNNKQLEEFIAWIKPQLTKHQRLVDVATSQERLGKTLAAGKQFLLLAGVIAVLLAGVAIAIAARQFSDRHTNQVALMKSLGTSAIRIRALYFGQLFILGCISAVIGLCLGYVIQQIVVSSLQQTYHLTLQPAHFYPYALSFLSGLVCLTFFALPALWFLPAIPPLKILRRELAVNTTQIWLQGTLALLAIVVLIGLFSLDLKLTLSISGTLLTVIFLSLLLSMLLLAISKKSALKLGGSWRLAFANLQRHKGQSLVQIMVFSIAIMLLLTLTIIRTSLIEEWKMQLPVNAPNHFLVNIPPTDLQDVQSMLQEEKISGAPLYPMVRGRLIQINGVDPNEEMVSKANALQRELNLTWSANLAEDNKILQGEWWNTWKKVQPLAGVSVEMETAKNLGLKLGDQLKFSLGGLIVDTQVASFRSVDWKSMQPNFFFIFEPGSLDAYSPTFMTSIYLAPQQKIFINQLLRKHPTMLVIEFDRIIDQMRTMINQVSDGIQLVLWLTLAAGALVLLAAVMSSIESRKQEAGLLRALGSPRRLILGSIFSEFAVVGFIAGVIAIFGAEMLLLSLQKFVLQTRIQPHYLYWLISPIGSALFISGLGLICCRHIVTTPPAIVLRESA